MFDILKDLKPNRPKVESHFQKKILCIIEGDLEFRYISRIFKLFGYEKGCYRLSEELIKIAWGKSSPSGNIVNKKCLFQGGSLEGSKVPLPAISAFEIFERDLSIFDSVFVFFDSDKDTNQNVKNYFIEKFSSLEIKHCLLVSTPCFESTLIDFCSCGNCREQINTLIDTQYPCQKYKNNFSQLGCFSGSKHLLLHLTMENILHLQSKDSQLNCVNHNVKRFLKNISF